MGQRNVDGPNVLLGSRPSILILIVKEVRGQLESPDDGIQCPHANWLVIAIEWDRKMTTAALYVRMMQHPVTQFLFLRFVSIDDLIHGAYDETAVVTNEDFLKAGVGYTNHNSVRVGRVASRAGLFDRLDF